MHWGWALSCLRNGALGGPDSFGTAGSAASRAWANPELGLAFAYTPNLCSLGHFERGSAEQGSNQICNGFDPTACECSSSE